MMRLAVLLVGLPLSGLFLGYLDPATSALFPPCLFRLVTGYLCPGCGSARAIHSFLHGEIAQALQLNPLPFSLLPMAIVDVLGRDSRYPTCREARPRFVTALAGAVILFGILRNFV